MVFSKGQVVYSKCGRDKCGLFIVMTADEDYVYISDGKTRKFAAPKKKKLKHVQRTNYIDRDINEKLTKDMPLLDADIRKALSKYKEIRNGEVISFVEG